MSEIRYSFFREDEIDYREVSMAIFVQCHRMFKRGDSIHRIHYCPKNPFGTGLINQAPTVSLRTNEVSMAISFFKVFRWNKYCLNTNRRLQKKRSESILLSYNHN